MKIEIPYYDDNSRISNSSIGLFLSSPKRLKKYLDGENEFASTASMKKGTMVHNYILEKSNFFDNYKILEFEVPSSQQQKQFCADYISSKENKPILRAFEAFKKNYSTTGQSDKNIAAKGLEMALKLKKYIKFLRMQESGSNVLPISWSDLTMLKQNESAIKLHKKANWLIYKSSDDSNIEANSEFHINWEINIDGIKIPLKSLIDRIIINHEAKHITLCDLKTTASIKDFKHSFSLYDYGRQLAFYWMAIYWYFRNELNIDIEEYTHDTFIVAINAESSEVKVFEIPDDVLNEKIEELRQILANIKWHIENGLWDYSKEYYNGDGSELLTL